MPESWVRGAILVRINSLIRGHSGVRWELVEKMAALLRANITPLVPLRGSISASGGTYTDPLELLRVLTALMMDRPITTILRGWDSHWEPIDSGF